MRRRAAAVQPAHARSPVDALARVDRRTKDLTKRLQLGEIAVINHADIDRVAAEGLIGAGVGAVLNAAPSITGRYPNGGPIRIVEAGILLVDDLGPEVMTTIEEGDQIHVAPDGEVTRNGHVLAKGRVRTIEDVTEAMEDARANIGAELERFAANTLEYIQHEAKITFEPLELPKLRTRFRGRHAMVVVRGHDYQSDLAALKPYLKEYEPVLIGVDGGADALLDLGFKPDIIIGDFDSLSDAAVHCGAELLHHVHPDGRAPGRENLEAMGFTPGKEYQEFVAEGMSEDVAMLLAYEAGASLIVAVGTHSTMVEMLDKGRKGMSSTFLTRLRLGPVLVDAKGVHRLYEGRVRRRDILVLVLAALFTIVIIGLVAQPLHTYVDGIRFTLDDLWYSITH
ncbi:MAG: putative cytokinetic ring protein SteA [Acidimicrobiia bacterium]